MRIDTSTKRGSADLSALEAAIGGAICLRRIGAGPAPTVSDRFEIEALIGTGGFGTVIRARDLHLERRVAIKLVPTDNPGRCSMAQSRPPPSDAWSREHGGEPRP